MFEIKFHDAFKEELKSLPDSLELRMVALIKRLRENPTSLREPHSKPIEGYKGLFELRAKAKDGIARSFFCYAAGKKIYLLRCFVKKTNATPLNELRIAIARKNELTEPSRD
ncbi:MULTISPECIES: type II toxin-antitoxin system RelE/ParE family toxin [Photorhabdus]|uniref:Type II toxin-antitoxin system RelE/ParE family toxin n=2 Tax=Photorhabdus TaxID=29487 RepID=A0AAW6BN37_9GAMM|nr:MULTISPECIES: type II toxin-antitoxin system RelE/ParE family toxin [Photorhabdus]MCT8351704.1 type II toxin-antitoxin system RelE/ParE family toxin [Photorhabdus kayaii]MDB6373175.1 type II toxin-antitoxin system RelE/ParE family toxin [Photorhabdus bodei]